MASYTPNYHLPKYDSTDKPNLRDQYNQAMDTIDNTLVTFNTSIASAVSNAEDAVEKTAEKADIMHASSNTTYGVGTAGLYGHLKITNDINNNANGTAISPAGVRSAFKYNPSQLSVAFIGDSWTAGYNENSPSSYKGFVHMIDDIGCFKRVYNYAKNGQGYVTGTTFSDIADELIADKPDIDVIVIIGGVNDLNTGTVSNMTTAANALFDKLLTAFPTINIVVAANVKESMTISQWNIISAPVNAALNRGLSGYHEFGNFAKTLGRYYLSDHYHLTEAGYRLLVMPILGMITGKQLNSDRVYQILMTNSSSLVDYLTQSGTSSMSIAMISSIDECSIAIYGNINSNTTATIKIPFNYICYMTNDNSSIGFGLFNIQRTNTYTQYLTATEKYNDDGLTLSVKNSASALAIFRCAITFSTKTQIPYDSYFAPTIKAID